MRVFFSHHCSLWHLILGYSKKKTILFFGYLAVFLPIFTLIYVKKKFFLFLVRFLFFLLIMMLIIQLILIWHTLFWICKYISPIFQTYRRLDHAGKSYWAQSIVSSIHAITTTSFAWIAIRSFDGNVNLFDTTPQSYFALEVGLTNKERT